MRVIVRKLYGFPIPEPGDLSWVNWVDLAIVAKKFSEPELRRKAIDRFVDVALLMTDVDHIFQTIGVVMIDEGRTDVEFRRAVTLIRKHHASVLLGHEGYRATLRHDPQLVLMHIDDLLAKVKSASEDGGEIDGEGSLS